MFCENIQNRLELLDRNVVKVSDVSLNLIETNRDGAADLRLNLQNPCILFEKLEHKKLKYFINDRCADYVVYEFNGEAWFIHIFELKRTIGPETWNNIKQQFLGAMQNALSIAGFLGIDVKMENIFVYSVYRNDKIADYANPGKLRYGMHRKDKDGQDEKTDDWHDGMINLAFLEKKGFWHKRIRLDVENGKGEYAIKKNTEIEKRK